MLYTWLVKSRELTPESEEFNQRELYREVDDCRYIQAEYESDTIKRLCGDLLIVSWDKSDEITDLFRIKNGRLERL